MLVNGKGLLFIARALRDYDVIFGDVAPSEANVRGVLVREIEPFIGLINEPALRYDMKCCVSRILEAVYVRRVIDGDSSLLEIPFDDGTIKVMIDPTIPKDEVRLIGVNKELIAKLINVKST